MTRIAVFASGSGTNAENIDRYFSAGSRAKVVLILTNNPRAGAVERARKLGIPCEVFSAQPGWGTEILWKLGEAKADFIALAGFLLLVPVEVLKAYKGKIVNIHPALLPQHGGKGFYGMRVHESVIRSGAIMSGITIHYVNEMFDEGRILFQAACHVSKNETPESLAEKIHKLEYAYYPVVIEKLLASINSQPLENPIH